MRYLYFVEMVVIAIDLTRLSAVEPLQVPRSRVLQYHNFHLAHMCQGARRFFEVWQKKQKKRKDKNSHRSAPSNSSLAAKAYYAGATFRRFI